MCQLYEDKKSKILEIDELNKNSEKLKEIYECKIKILTSKNEEVLIELKSEIKKKNEVRLYICNLLI